MAAKISSLRFCRPPTSSREGKVRMNGQPDLQILASTFASSEALFGALLCRVPSEEEKMELGAQHDDPSPHNPMPHAPTSHENWMLQFGHI